MVEPISSVTIGPVPAVQNGGELPTPGLATLVSGIDMATIAKGIVAGCSVAWRRFAAWKWPHQPDRRVVGGLSTLDEVEYGEERRWKLTLKWCALAKAQFGTIRVRTAADDEAIAVWLRKEMAAVNVRVCDRLRVIPYAVASVYVPTNSDLEAENLLRLPEVKARRKLMGDGKRR